MAATTKKKVLLNFTMQPQVGHALCWAAVGTSCALFYDPTSGWTQCNLASDSIVPPVGDCCSNPESSPCDIPWYLQNEDDLGSFVTAKIAHNFHEGFIPFARLMKELDQGRLVAYLLEIDIDGEIENMNKFSHFLVIAGYESTATEQTVFIYDSYFGKSEMAYKDFVTNYKCNGGKVDVPQGGKVDEFTVTRGLVKYTFFSTPAKKS